MYEIIEIAHIEQERRAIDVLDHWQFSQHYELTQLPLAHGEVRRGVEPVKTVTGQVKILTLTPNGRAHLANHGVTTTRFRAGGAAHEYWRHQIRGALEQRGYTVTEEFAIGNGQTVDLHARHARKPNVFVEIESGTSDIATNIAKAEGLRGQFLVLFITHALRAKYAPLLNNNPAVIALVPDDLQGLDDVLS